MKLLYILFGAMIYFASVSGRNLRENTKNYEYTIDDLEKPSINPTARQMRDLRQPRQPFYDYNYHDYRRDYNQQQEETFDQILGYLEEIAYNVRRTPPAPSQPQIIYIPYPVPYYVPPNINYNKKGQPMINNIEPPKNLSSRWPIVEDVNQIFGLVSGVVDTGNSDGSRPINLDPIPPSVNLNEQSKVDHGTTQVGTEEPNIEMKKPVLCKAAVLICCNLKEAEQRCCFNKYDCPRTYETGLACRPEIIKKVLEELDGAYAE